MLLVEEGLSLCNRLLCSCTVPINVSVQIKHKNYKNINSAKHETAL